MIRRATSNSMSNTWGTGLRYSCRTQLRMWSKVFSDSHSASRASHYRYNSLSWKSDVVLSK